MSTEAIPHLPAASAPGGEPAPRRSSTPLGDTLLSACWVGIVAGLLEAGIVKLGALVLHLPTSRLARPEVFWMTPVAAAGCLVVVGLVLALLDAAFRRTKWWPSLDSLAIPVYVALSTYSIIRLLRQGVASFAAVILTIGIAVFLRRVLAKHPTFVRRRVRPMLPWMVGALVFYALGIVAARRLQERRALAGLPPAPPDAPNVLVVVLDAVRQFDLSLYGYERETSPRLDQLASRGVVFERAFTTAPWSLPSHASMLTGRYPHEMSAGHRQALDGSLPLVSEVLARHGYATGGFVGNMAWLQPDFGLSRGFITYSASPSLSLAELLTTWWLGKDTYEKVALLRGDHGLSSRRRADDVNDALTAWLQRRGRRPFFAFVNYFDAHEPYLPPAPFDTLFSAKERRYWRDEVPQPYSADALADFRAAYDAGIRYEDAQLGRLLDHLRASGELDRTIVIVTADHGEEFGEWDPSLVGHSMTLKTTSTLIPMVLVYPPRVPAGLRLNMPVSLRDLPATIVDLTGVQATPAFHGVSLASYAADSARRPTPTPRVMMVEHQHKGDLPSWSANDGDLFAVTDGSLHFILDAQKRQHLFDLSEDVWERNDLAAREDMAPEVKRVRALLDSLVARPDGRLLPRAPSAGRNFKVKRR